MRKQVILGALALTLAFATAVAAQTPQASDVYRWSGELVSFDQAARTISIKARIVDQDAVTGLKRFKAGDSVFLTWSGFDNWADGIRHVGSSPQSGDAHKRFVLPVELVSTETPNQYLTFRVRVPASSVAGLTPLKSGEWVTATSRHDPANKDEAIVTMAPYVASAARPTT